MKILIAHNRYREAGGEDAVVAAERALLAAHGHETLAFEVSNDSVAGLCGRLATAWRASYSTAARDALAARLAAERPILVHIHNFFPLLSPSLYDACRDAGVAVVQTLHNYRLICPGAMLRRDGRVCEDCVTGSAYRAALHGCYRGSRPGSLAVARMVERHRRLGTWREKVDRYIALTRFARGRFIAGGLPAERIAVKPNFLAEPAGGASAPAGGGDRSGALYVGRLSAEKGVLALVEAWNDLTNEPGDDFDCPLRIAGDGPLAEQLRRRAGPAIRLLGPLGPGEVAAEMARAAFLVVPSECYEGFPMVIAEAYARALPVLAANIGGLAEIVENGVTGLHFAPFDARDLARRARWAAANREALARMGAAARERFEVCYSAEANYRALEAIYAEALDG